MIEKYIRSGYQSFFVDPLARIVSAYLSPSLFTLLGCLTGLLSAVFIFLDFRYLSILFLLLSGYCDTLDGTIARLKKCAGALGTAWDIVSDRIVEAAVVIGLFLHAPQVRALPALFMMASILICITSFLVVGIFSENQTEKSFFYSPGIIERAEAFLFFVLMILFPSFFVLLSSLFTLLVLLTAGIRLVQFANIWNGR